MKFEGKVVVVTGAAQGIGRAILTAFAEEGAQVAAIDLKDLSEEQGVTNYPFDLSDTEKIAGLVSQIEQEIGEIDILVNSAGICPTRPLQDCDIPTWKKVFEVNVHAPFFLIQAVSQSMIRRKTGAIINLASISGFLPKLEQIDYGASKAAVVSLTRSTAAILGPHGVRVNAIAPGVIDTPLTQNIANQRSQIRGVPPEETLRPVIEATPLRRMGSADEVADLALFLASEESAFITGQTIDVCGGQLMR